MTGHNFVFNLVFCATAATIVSGAMAERTKFYRLLHLFTQLFHSVVYPIEAHWIWGGGWLATALASMISQVPAQYIWSAVLSALIGAAILGPRIGKFTKDQGRQDQGQRYFPVINILLVRLGCFILWFGWYGFNGAARNFETSAWHQSL